MLCAARHATFDYAAVMLPPDAARCCYAIADMHIRFYARRLILMPPRERRAYAMRRDDAAVTRVDANAADAVSLLSPRALRHAILIFAVTSCCR